MLLQYITNRWPSCTVISCLLWRRVVCLFLTLHRSQLLCNLQWPSGVSGGALSCWHLNPAPGLHLLAQVKPAKCHSSLVQFKVARAKQQTGWLSATSLHLCITNWILPFHSWHFLNSCGCTWASPWQPPARPAQYPPSIGTWVSSWPALPAAGGPAGLLIRLTGWGGWGWRGCPSLSRWGEGTGRGYTWVMQLCVWVRAEVAVGAVSNEKTDKQC